MPQTEHPAVLCNRTADTLKSRKSFQILHSLQIFWLKSIILSTQKVWNFKKIFQKFYLKNLSKNRSKMFQKSALKICQKISPKNPSKRSYSKICQKNLPKFMNWLKIFSDYTFLIHKLPKRAFSPALLWDIDIFWVF